MARGAGETVAVGGAVVLRSEEGGAWSVVEPPVRDAFMAVVWTGQRYVACGAAGSVQVSDDGRRWVEDLSEPLRPYWAVTWGHGAYWAVTEDGEIRTSTDGRAWLAAFAAEDIALYGVYADDGAVIPVGRDREIYTAAIALSFDGVSWRTDVTVPERPLRLQAVVRVGNRFVAYGRGTIDDGLSEGGTMLTSADGLAWSKENFAEWMYLDTVVGNGRVVVGIGGEITIGPVLAVSEDGVAWDILLRPEPHLDALSWTGSHFVATAGTTLYTSRDGRSWTAEPTVFSHTPRAIAARPHQLVVAGEAASILTARHVSALPRCGGQRVGGG